MFFYVIIILGDDMEQEIIETIKKLKKAGDCPTCFATVSNGNSTCRWCGEKNQLFEELMHKLDAMLKNNPINNNILIELVDLRNLGIPFVEKIIDDNGQSLIAHLYEERSKNDLSNSLKLLSKDNAETVIDQSVFFEIARKIFINEPGIIVTDEAYLSFIEKYAQKIIDISNCRSQLGAMPELNFVSDEEAKQLNRVNGDNGHPLAVTNKTQHGFVVSLNRDLFLEGKSKGETWKNIFAIYHDLQHVIQYNYFTLPQKFSTLGLTMAKEIAIDDSNSSYYSDNYEKNSLEIDADLVACRCIINDFSNLKLVLQGLNEHKQKLENLLSSQKRVLNGVESTVDEIFAQVVVDPSLLSKYPILQLQYRVEGGAIVEKSIEEIENEAKLNPQFEPIYRSIIESKIKEKTI